MRRWRVSVVVGVALWAGLVPGALAAERYFLATAGDWFEPANWDPPVVPAAEDNVTVPDGVTVALTADAEITDLNLTGGTLSGPGHLVVHGLLSWSSGAMAGSGSVTAAHAAILEGAELELAGGRLVNAGEATLSGTGTVLRMRDGAVLENRAGATFEIQNDDGIAAGGPNTRLINAGTLRRGVSEGTAAIGASLANDGRLEVRSGALELTGGGSSAGVFDAAGGDLRFAAGTHLLAPGAHVGGQLTFSGATVRVDGAYAAGTTEISGGTVHFGNPSGASTTALVLSGGVLAGTAAVTVDGLLSWSGGAMRGAGTTVIAGDAVLEGDLALDERRLVNAGNAIVAGDDTVLHIGGGVVENRFGATFDMQDDASVLPSGSGSAAVANAGVFRRRLGSGIATVGVAFSNSGLVEIASGTLHCAALYRQTDGETRMGGGALAAEAGLELAGGRLTGSGSIRGDVVNRAVIAPGFSAGRLHIDGSYTQAATGALEIQIGGRTAGSGFDQLAIDGAAVLDGRLAVALIDGFGPADGDRFDVVTFASRTGTFAAVDGLLLDEGFGFDAVGGATSVALVFGRETCGNGGDDDGNGLADCLDPKCAQADACTGTPTQTPTASPTATPTDTAPPASATSTAVPTATGTATPDCPGDCDDDGVVTIAELVRAAHLALGSAGTEPCPRADRDRSGRIGIDELVGAVDRALSGCAAARLR